MPKPKSMSHQGVQEVADDLELDPIIIGLLEKLPASGETWDKPDRVKWLNLLGGALDLIYKDKPVAPAATPPVPPGVR